MNNQQQQPRQPQQTQMFGQNQNATIPVPQSPLLEPISRSVAPTISYTNSALAIAAAAAAAAAAANNANNTATNSNNNLAHQIQQQQPPLMSTSTSNNAVLQPTMVNQQQQPATANQSIITQQQQQAVAAIQPQQQPQPKMRKEIYRYTCDEAVFAAAWSNKVYEDKRFRLLAGTILDEDNIMNNKIFMVELDENVGELVRKATFAHGYPISATKFIPNQDPSQPELFATTSNHLRIFRYHPGKDSITLECELNSMKSNMYAAPLTNLDWNEVDPSLVATCSIDTTCCVWNVETSQMVGQALTVKGTQKTQLIAHEKPVHDIAFARLDNGGRDQFATAGADGSVRLFDLRSLQHSTILYEDMEKRMLNHIAWNKRDPYKIAAVAHESYEVVILDVRVPCRPMAKFGNHRGYVNGIAWAPHSTVHICTAGSDRQALIWQMNHFNRDEPILAYTAEGEINQIHWSSNFHQWICICFDNSMEILRV